MAPDTAPATYGEAWEPGTQAAGTTPAPSSTSPRSRAICAIASGAAGGSERQRLSGPVGAFCPVRPRTYVRSSGRIGHGQAITGAPARAGAEHRADREAVWKGPFDGLVLDEEVWLRVALQGQARRQGRDRPRAVRRASGGRHDDRADRGGAGSEHRHRSPLDATVRTLDPERAWEEAARDRAVGQRRRPALNYDDVPPPRGDGVLPRRARLLPLQAMPVGSG